MTVDQLPMYITLYGVVAILAALISYIVAAAKHRDASHWATIAFLFPPAVLVPLLMTTAPIEHRHANIVERKLRKFFEHD